MLIHRLLNRFYEDAAGGDTQGGGGGDTVSGGAADTAGGGGGDTQGGGGGGGDTVQGGGKTLLEELGGKGGDTIEGGADTLGGGNKGKQLTAEQKALAASEKDARRPKDVPAKYWDAEKGEVKFTAWASSTKELETRMRTFGLPPKEAKEYKFELPQALKEAGIDVDPAMANGFRALAFEQGLTQKQYEAVMGAYFKNIASTADQMTQFGMAKAREALMGHYKTKKAMTKAVQRAYTAASAFLPEDQLTSFMASAGNIPGVIMILDRVGKEMAEDPGVNPDAILSSESLDELMRGGPGQENSPYWNANDPRHASTVAKVARHHEAVAAARQRRQ